MYINSPHRPDFLADEITAMQRKGRHLLLLAIVSVIQVAACSSANSGTAAPVATSYVIGGAVSGLASTGLILQDNGGDNLPISANGGFQFDTLIPTGGSYNVTILTQPSQSGAEL